ncbi:ribonuclease H-like domain-containing protein [Tanacetum coccineum]
MLVSTSIIFPSANSTKYLVSTVDGTMSLKGLILAEVRLLSTRFHVLAIISSFASTSCPSKVLSIRESHNLRDSNSQEVFSAIKELVDIVKKTLELGAWGVEFGVPKALISDRETHFCNSQLEKALRIYGVAHKLSTAYHPQSNGQTEVTNRAIKHYSAEVNAASENMLEVTTASEYQVNAAKALKEKNLFLLKDMDQDSAHMVAASKVPMLKSGSKKIRVKARSTLMMGIPNEHQLKFNFIKDAKKLLKAVEKRFDEKLSQEDVNKKLLRSLSPEWNTHVVVWRNKADLDTMSMDDLYNNLKVYEPEVKGMYSSSSSTQNMAFVSFSNNNSSSTNEAVNTAHGISTASTQVNAANSPNIDNLSDVVICSFFASQPNSPQLVHEDLHQIHQMSIEEMI